MRRNKNVEIITKNIPKKRGWGGKECYDWEKFIPNDIEMILDGVLYNFKLLEFIKGKHSKVVVEYKEEKFEKDINAFINGEIGSIIGTKTTKYYYDLGKMVDTNTGKVLIVKHIKIKNGYDKYSRRGYIVKCCNEGYEYEVVEENLKNKTGCPVCSNRIVVEGVNDISTTHPEKVQYFLNKHEAYSNTYGSQNRVSCICPFCNEIKNDVSIASLIKNNYNCPRCGDGIPFTERFMFSLLKYKLGDNFYREFNPNWDGLGLKRYDFYFELNNNKYIIEMHGFQHYSKGCFESISGRDFEFEVNNDKYKLDIAINNGILKDNYIIIDCSESKFNFIKTNIYRSRLNDILKLEELTDEEWLKILENSMKNRYSDICNLWNMGYSVGMIKRYFKCSPNPVIEALKLGKEIGICNDYTTEESRKRGNEMYKINKTTKIVCSTKDMQFVL